jgi:hypothetical protein
MNQVSGASGFSQSGFEGLGTEPIRFQWPRNAAKQVSVVAEFGQSGFLRVRECEVEGECHVLKFDVKCLLFIVQNKEYIYYVIDILLRNIE